jgi:hypothetical protein
MYLCGLDCDEQPTAINLAHARSIVLMRDPDGDTLLVEWSDTETSRTVAAQDAIVAEGTMLLPTLRHLAKKARGACS